MLKRAQCQVAREHQQTMASVVLGCRGCHQTGECGSGCQGAPTGWQTWCRAVRGHRSSPGGEQSSSLRPGCSVSLQGPSRKSARDQSPAKCCGQECPILPPTSPEPPLQPCLLCAQGLWLLFRAAGRTPGSCQACLTAGAPLRRSLRQHPHDCQSSGDNELLMCLKSDAGCMARS